MTTTSAQASFRLGEWEIHPELNRLLHGGDVTVLEPRVMAVLVALVRRAGRVAGRTELLDEVWCDAVVGEEQLTRAVSELRRLFGDDPKHPRYIETIYKKGYRVVAAVEPLAPNAGPNPRTRPASPAGTTAPHHQHRVSTTLGAALALAVVAGGAVWFLSHPATETATMTDAPRVVPLTTLPGRETQPAISPDGTRVVFSWRGDDAAGGQDLWLVQAGASRPVRLTDLPGDELLARWTDDGREIAFAHVDDRRCRILAMPAIGGTERVLAHCSPALLGLDLTPDGRRMVVADQLPGSDRRGLTVADLETGDVRTLTRCEAAWQYDTTPRVSPDGQSVAFRRKLGEAWYEVFAVPIGGGPVARVTRDGQDNGGLDWSADGGGVVYSSNRGGTFGLWLQRLDGGAPRWLGVEDAYVPSVARERGTIVVERRRWDSDIWRLPLQPGTLVADSNRWTGSTRADLDPRISHAGGQVAFVSWRSAGHELWIAAADGTDARRVTYFDRPAPAWRPTVQHPRWSPDDAELAIAARLESGFDIYTVGADGAPPVRWTDHPADDLAPAWSGTGLVFASNRSGDWQLWRMARGGEPEQLTTEPILPFVEADTAGRPLFSRGAGGLWRLDADGAERRILDQPVAGRWTTWGDRVVLLAADEVEIMDIGEPGGIRSLPIEGLAPAGGLAVADAGLSVAPDGTSLLYSRLVSNASDLDLVTGLP